jgi:hypothetical protein
MATVLRSNLETIIPVVLARLQAVTGFPPERCFPTVEDPVGYHCQADQYIVLQIDTEDTNLMTNEAEGRFDDRQMRRIAVHLRTRLNLDETGHDYQWLLNATLGHLRLERQIKDALSGFIPVDSGDNWLGLCGMDPAPVQRPRKANPAEPGWGESVLGFVIPYIQDLDQTYLG